MSDFLGGVDIKYYVRNYWKFCNSPLVDYYKSSKYVIRVSNKWNSLLKLFNNRNQTESPSFAR